MAVETIENLWIPLADGTRLAARLWRPDDAEAHPVPAILEYIPYRKRDGTRGRDEPMHGFFASQGYAAIRVDMRGSGDSDGVLDDEYLPQEQDDALEVIAWLAAQPWCTGAVGMMGKSWGGFNALQVAARRPPALKAIITVCSTDDRFADDIHFMGGCLLNDNLWWGSIMLAYQARPADPAIVGEGWRAQWLERLDHMPLWPALWMNHQSRDAYWRHGSVNEDLGAITCPVLAVGGWADAYTNAVPRLLEGLSCPRQGLIGPWAHIYPQDGVPGPSVDFLGEATRWWDTWLKGQNTGIMDGPMLRAFIEDHRTPTTTLPAVEGRFVAEPAWPSPSIADQAWSFGPGRLLPGAAEAATLSIRSPLWTGTTGGEWMGTGVVGEMPADQRLDDGLSLVFDTEPLAADQDVLGFPVVTLELAADRPHAQLALRLCDVAPDGSSLRISYAVLNLDHRDGSAAPAPLVPGERLQVRVPLKVCGHRFPAGHRIRLAVATACWPLVWPARDAATLTLFTPACRLVLPVRPDRPGEPPLTLPPGRGGAPTPRTLLREGRITRGVSFDQVTGKAVSTTVGEGGLFGEGVGIWDDIGTTVSHDLTRRLSVAADDPDSAEATIDQVYSMLREDGWAIRIETRVTLAGDRDAFRLNATLKAFEGDAEVATRTWSETIPRLHV
ncbi:CocE/NonD family hydrolase [Lichenihabitans sp. Uapishka_5]|uniref:CocE/NonD family hydrolase n=1 Tax=Lichenihabitans sp. Uapishka_5 TaxID=3037302 RepID=UPI0029E7E7D8|nr:CocE/NonD family hydrolase [Lichenihabitans sp. Uapishka_5]MDX7952916.1 CocE/NonD family hydrolase [Lichenihabitans sp. Uapishka_5]